MNPIDNQQHVVLAAGQVEAPGWFALNRVTSIAFTVAGGTVNFQTAHAFDTATNAPTGWASDAGSPYAAGIYTVHPRANYGRFTVASSTPTVTMRRFDGTV